MNKKVVLIESDPWLGEHFGQVLERDGFAVMRVSHAYAAVDAINNDRPDAIGMSMMLSGVNGLNLLHELQSYTDTATIPVIVWSTQSDGASLEDLQPYGVQRVLDTTTMQPGDVAAAFRSVLA